MEKVIIILCDTLRAKSLPHYGNSKNTLPNLGSIIDKDFMTYERAYAPSSWTAPSHMSLFTGLYPSQAMETPESLRLDSTFKTLPELFKDSGFNTYASSANILISKKMGFDKGVDHFLQSWIPFPEAEEVMFSLEGNNKFEKLFKLFSLLSKKESRSRASRGLVENLYKTFRGINQDATFSTNKIMKLLKKHIFENSKNKLFSYVNLMQTHSIYNPPRITRYKFGARDKNIEDRCKNLPPLDHYAIKKFDDEMIEYAKLRYEEEVLYLDIVINDFILFLKANGMYDNSTIIITSDHGEHFGENGHVAHAFSVFDPLIKIPLYIKWSGERENSAGSSGNLVMLQDLYSTFISYLDHWYPSPDSSIDLTSSSKRLWALAQLNGMSTNINGCMAKRPSFSINDIGLQGDTLAAYMFDDGEKIIENGKKMTCYSLKDDPDEVDPVNVSSEQVKAVEKIKEIIE